MKQFSFERSKQAIDPNVKRPPSEFEHNETIQLKNLSFGYQKNRPIFENINLEIKPSSRIAIIGRNGAGKTTLVETLIGLNKPTTGEVIFPQSLLNSTGSVFQDIDFDNGVKLSEIFLFFARIANDRIKKMSNEELRRIFEKYELENHLRKKFSTLSGGQKQKFKLLLCLELNPKVLLLDELTTALDFEWRNKIVKLIKQYLNDNPQAILILVSHSKDEIEELTNERYLLKDKKLLKIDDLDKYFGK